MKKNNKTIIITGTHHTPAIELIKQLQKDQKINWKIYYIAHQKDNLTHINNVIKKELHIPVYLIPCGKFDRRFLDKTILSIPDIFRGISQSLKIIGSLKPNIVISFGGFVSVPVIFAAFLKKIPSITHEQTLTLSLSTKINSIFSQAVALSFDLHKLNKKFVVTGNLLRSEIFNSKNVTKKRPLIYVTGGNQGSVSINNILLKILPSLSKKYSVIHQTGHIDFPKFNRLSFSFYQAHDYISSKDIGWILNNADLIISRSGANTCQEIAALHKRALLIPHPYTQQNEQLSNARWLKKQSPKITVIIEQKDLTPELLLSSIEKLIKIPYQHRSVDNHQNPRILNLIHEII